MSTNKYWSWVGLRISLSIYSGNWGQYYNSHMDVAWSPFFSFSVMDMPNYCWLVLSNIDEWICLLSALISYPQEIWDKKNNTFVVCVRLRELSTLWGSFQLLTWQILRYWNCGSSLLYPTWWYDKIRLAVKGLYGIRSFKVPLVSVAQRYSQNILGFSATC